MQKEEEITTGRQHGGLEPGPGQRETSLHVSLVLLSKLPLSPGSYLLLLVVLRLGTKVPKGLCAVLSSNT